MVTAVTAQHFLYDYDYSRNCVHSRLNTLGRVIAITLSGPRNKGSDKHTLKCCDFGGWDSKEQFTVINKRWTAQQRQQCHHSQEKSPGSSEQQGTGPDVADGQDRDVPGETMADILPGERFSVAVACHAK